MRNLFTSVTIYFLTGICVFGQITINSNMTSEVTVNGSNGNYEFSITNTSGGTITDVSMDIDVPQGIKYIDGSMVSTTGHLFTVTDAGNYIFKMNSIAPGAIATFSLSLSASCTSIDFQLGGGVFRNKVKLSYTGFNLTHNSNPYNILYAALTVLSVNPKDVSIVSGQSIIRTITIVNGGNGSINNFIVRSIQGAEVTLTATSHGTIVNNTIELTGSDFTSLGNSNSSFDQDETIAIQITYKGLSCTDKTVSSTISAGWSGESGFCQNSTTNANTFIDFSEPVIAIANTSSLLNCSDSNTPHEQLITLTNTGSGVAANLVVDIFKSSGGAYDQNLLSRFDVTSIMYRINGGAYVAISPTSSSSTSVVGAYACLGAGAKGQFILEFAQLDPGAVLDIKWNMYTCCSVICNTPQVGGWAVDIDYADVCAGATYSGSKVGQTPVSASMSVFTESEPEISNGERALYNYIISSYDNTYTTSVDSRMELIFTIPKGLKLASNNDIQWVSAPLSWEESLLEYNQSTGVLRLLYIMPSNFSLPKSEINLFLTADCAMSGATAGNKSILLDVNFIKDINCLTSCPVPLICQSSLSTLLQCPDEACLTGGVRNVSYDLYRSSYGLPDNNEDGYPEAGSLDFNKIKLNRVMVGDTLDAVLSGVVHDGSGVTQWSYAYADVVLPLGVNFNALGATISVYDQSTDQQYTINSTSVTKTMQGNNALFTVNIGSGLGTYKFESGDVVEVKLHVKVVGNIGDNVQELTSSAKLYASTVSNPSEGQKYFCNEFLDNITLIGYFYSVSAVDNITVTGCNKTIQQDFYFSVGNCCNNFGGGNLFPYEYRNWSTVATAKVVIPPYYKINSVDLKQYNTKGTNSTFTQTVSGILNDYKNRDTLIYDLSQYYDSNQLHFSDDGFSGRMLINVSPTCDIPLNTYQDVYWGFNFNESKYLSNTTTKWYSSNPDRIRYNPSKIAVTSSNPIQDGLSKTVSWNVSVKNPISNESLSSWVHLVSPTSKVQIKRVIDKSSGDTLQKTNDLYLLDALNNGEKRDLQIDATYSACVKEKLFVYSGYECDVVPANYAAVKCPHNYLEVNVDPKPTQMQAQISSQIIGGNCSPIFEVELLMSSVRIAAVDSLGITVTVPESQSILYVPTTNYFAYPNTEAYSLIADPILSGQTYSIPVYALDEYVEGNALPGATNVNGNKIKVKMQFEMQGNYKPGDFLEFSFNGERTCGDDLPQINLAVDPVVSLKEYEITGLTTDLGDNWSVSWGDYNNDGLEDVFITEYAKNKPNTLYKNNGNLSFTKVTTGAIVTDLASSIAASWADYDNDGDLDLFVANNLGSPNFLYRNEGNETFTRVLNGHMGTYDGYCHGAAWADYNLDGYLDLFVSDYMPTRVNLLYKNLKDGTFELVSSGDIVSQTGHSIGASWADADGDGDPDLFVPNAGEKNFFYLNQGGTMVAQPSSQLSESAYYSVGGSWGDYDNDGDLDLFVANASKTTNRLYINDGAANFTLSPVVIGTGSDDTHGSTWADFDNDGDLDLFITNDQLEPKSYYTNNGDGTFNELDTDLTNLHQNSFGTAVADVENDGDLDLFIANHSGEDNVLFVNGRGSCQNSFCATLVGTGSNRSAVGAKVYATANVYGQEITQMREVSTQTGGGAGGQNTMKVYLGLGDATQIDLLKIEWPSGVVQQIINEPTGACVTIFEEGGSLISGVAYLDANANCIQDAGEQVLANQEIIVQPNDKKVFTDRNGVYQIYVSDGTYTLAGATKENFSSSCTEITEVVVGGGVNSYTSSKIGFQSTCASPDLSMNLATAALRRGFSSDLFVNIFNKGGATANNVVYKFVTPNGMLVNHASIPWDATNGDTLFWYFDELKVEENIAFVINEKVTLSLSINDVVEHKTLINSDNPSDCTPLDNLLTYNVQIVGAIDPNDKNIVFSDGRTRNYALKDEILNYKIRFQNIGTYYASRVVVIDTLDIKLDINTIKNVMSSHKYKLQIDGRILRWTFDDIELPAKENDLEGSNGFISFDIQLKESVLINSELRNTAHIQFDFEDFITTNEVKNQVLSAHPSNSSLNGIIVITPNPVSDQALISLWSTTSAGDVKLTSSSHQVYFNELRVLSITGKLIMKYEMDSNLNYSIDCSHLVSGVYILKAKDASGKEYYGKMVKK